MSTKPLVKLRCNRLHCNGIPVLTETVDDVVGVGAVPHYQVMCPACGLEGKQFDGIPQKGETWREADEQAKKKAIGFWLAM